MSGRSYKTGANFSVTRPRKRDASPVERCKLMEDKTEPPPTLLKQYNTLHDQTKELAAGTPRDQECLVTAILLKAKKGTCTEV